MDSTKLNAPTIMVVDDTPANLRLLGEMLRSQGYRVVAFPQGALALKAAEKTPPDLILMDIKMPDMDGFEVCRRLKESDALKDIPVIFVSSLSDIVSKVEGFRAGGVDYVSKPFQFEEVVARVETHLLLRRQRKEIEAAYAKLREMEASRDALVHMVVHDMRSPLTVVIFNLASATEMQLPPDAAAAIADSLLASQTLVEMVDSMLDVSKMEAAQLVLSLSPVDLRQLAKNQVERLEALKGQRTVTLCLPEQMQTVMCDEHLVGRVLQNLLFNALKFTNILQGAIAVTVSSSAECVRVEVADNGRGIPEEHRAKVFDKFYQVASRGRGHMHSSGLGLTFCKLAVEAHGGRIGVESAVGQGSRFWFELDEVVLS